MSINDASDDSWSYNNGSLVSNYTSTSMSAGTYDAGTQVAHDFLHFPGVTTGTGNLTNDNILSVGLGLYNYYSWSCNARGVYVHEITQSWSGSSTTSWPSVASGYLDSPPAQFAYGYASNCAANWALIDLGQPGIDLLNAWTHGTKTNNGLDVEASGTDNYAWKKFNTANASSGVPYLAINYTPYGAKYAVNNSVTNLTNNTSGHQDVTVTNWGTASWPANGNYRLSYHVYDSAGTLLQYDGTRTLLPSMVAPRASLRVTATIGQLAPASYLIRWDMLNEGVTWFSTQGVSVLQEPVSVPNLAPQVDNTLPRSGVSLYTLTPTLSVFGHDLDNWPGSLNYDVQVFDATSNAVVVDSGWQTSNDYTVPAGKLAWGKEYYWKGWVGDTKIGSPASGASFFGTVVPQPPQSSRFGVDAAHGGADPATGNWSTSSADVSIPGAGIPLQLSRTYNSQDPGSNGAFGAGWSSLLDMQATADGDGTGNVTVRLQDGHTARFGKNNDGAFISPATLPSVLTYDTPSSTYALALAGGYRYHFSNAGKLDTVTAPAGWTETFTYIGNTLTITNSVSGRALQVVFTGSHVDTITAPPNTAGGTVPLWQYSYTGNALSSVCPPGASPGANCTNYTLSNLTNHYRSSVLDAAPLAYWRLNDSTGSTAGDAILSNGTTLEGTQANTILGAPGVLTNSPRTSTTFNGTSSLIVLPSRLYNNFNALAVELWFHTGAPGVMLSTQNTAIGTAATNFAPMLYIGADGKLRGEFFSGAATPVTTTNSVTDNAWHHVALSTDGNVQSLYLDGTLIGTRTGAVDWQANTFSYLGAGYTSASWPSTPAALGTSYFKGGLEEVALYPHPLSASSVAAHYAARSGDTVMSSLVAPGGVTSATIGIDPGLDRVFSTTGAVGSWTNFNPASAPNNRVTYQATDGVGQTFTWTNDANGQLVSQTDPLGTRTFGYDDLAHAQTTKDENGHTTSVTRDNSGAITSRTVCRVQGVSSCTTPYTAYYTNNTTVAATDPRYSKLLTSRDARSASATDSAYLTSHAYDTNGNLTKLTTPATSDFSSGRNTVYGYTVGTEAAYGGGTEPAGLLATTNTARSLVTGYQYYANGDLGQRTDSGGLITRYAYDNAGHLASTTLVYNHGASTAVTSYANYNWLNHVGTITQPTVTDTAAAPAKTHTRITNYVYNPDGQTKTMTVTDGAGNDASRLTQHSYWPDGRLKTVTDPTNASTTYTYDGNGSVLSVTTPRAETDYGYNARREQTTATLKNYTGDPTNPSAPTDLVLQSRAYDPAGRLANVTNDMGRTTRYTYWDDDLPASQILDYRLTAGIRPIVLDDRSYDPAGNLTEEVTGNGKTDVRTVIDAAGRTTSRTLDPTGLNRTSSYTYDADNNTASTTLSDTTTTRTRLFQYDNGEQLSLQTVKNDATADLITTYGHDERELLSSVTTPLGDATGGIASDHTTSYAHDALGQLTSATQAPVLVETGGQAPVTQNPVALIGYDTFGAAADNKDPNGNLSSSTFDGDGRPLAVKSPSYTRPSDSVVLTPTVTRSYFPDGLLKSQTDPRAEQSDYTYDQLGQLWQDQQPAAVSGQPRPTWTYHPDYLGELLSSTDPTGAFTSATYDDLGLTVTRTETERNPAATMTTSLSYDDAGNPTGAISPLGVTHTSQYDAANELSWVKDTSLNTATFSYLVDGQTASVTDSVGRVRKTSYDLAGRLTYTNDYAPAPGSALLRTTGPVVTDLDSRVTSVTDARGSTTQASYDALGTRLTTTRPVDATPRTITQSYGYDANRNPTRRTDGRASSTLTSYNSQDLLESVTEPSTTAYPSLSDRTWTASYDASANFTNLSSPGGVTASRSYDSLNRLTSEAGTGAEAATSSRTLSYDLAGRLTSLNAASGTQTLSYNDRGLLTGTAGPEGSATLAYNGDGQLRQRTDISGSTVFSYDSSARLLTAADPLTGTTHTYGYYPDSKLKSETYGTGNDTRGYTYDNLGRLATDALSSGAGSTITSNTYGYDNNDNLTSKDIVGGVGAGHNGYRYDQSNRLSSWTNPANGVTNYGYDNSDNRTSAEAKTFVYDARNRLLSDSTGLTNTYTARGTLRASTPNGGPTVTSAFDAYDRLMSEGGATYNYDGLDRLTNRASSSFSYADASNAPVSDGTETYTRRPDGALIGLKSGVTALATFTDQHGDLVGTYQPSVAALTDSEGFDPWGTTTASSGTLRDLGYQSSWTDPTTGKVNMHARWYNPNQAGFTTRDTYTDTTPGANTTNYVANNPLDGIDPTGHKGFWDNAVSFVLSASSTAIEEAVVTAAVVDTIEITGPVLVFWYITQPTSLASGCGGWDTICQPATPQEPGRHPDFNGNGGNGGDGGSNSGGGGNQVTPRHQGTTARGHSGGSGCSSCHVRPRPVAPPHPPVQPKIGPPAVITLTTAGHDIVAALQPKAYNPAVCTGVSCGTGRNSGNVGSSDLSPQDNPEAPQPEPSVDAAGAGSGQCPPNDWSAAEGKQPTSDELRGEARDKWAAATGRPASWDRLEVHHIVPLEWRGIFSGDINALDNLAGMLRGDHGGLTEAWRQWKVGLGGQAPTEEQLLAQRDSLSRMYGPLFRSPC